MARVQVDATAFALRKRRITVTVATSQTNLIVDTLTIDLVSVYSSGFLALRQPHPEVLP